MLSHNTPKSPLLHKLKWQFIFNNHLCNRFSNFIIIILPSRQRTYSSTSFLIVGRRLQVQQCLTRLCIVGVFYAHIHVITKRWCSSFFGIIFVRLGVVITLSFRNDAIVILGLLKVIPHHRPFFRTFPIQQRLSIGHMWA